MTDQAAVSLIVSTHNRVASLRRCVAALFSTDPDVPFELVIVDNASSDETKEFLSALPCKYNHISIKILTEKNPGLGCAQNAACRVSTGSIVALTDDDCYVTPDYIRAIQSSFENPLIGVVGGRILLYDPQDYNITTRTDESSEFYKPYTFIRPGALQGANLAFRRSVLEAIGGFDDRFGPGGAFNGVDVVAVASALWRGFSAMYDPKPTVYHHHQRRTPEQLAKLWREYRIGTGAYFMIFICNPVSRRTYMFQFAKRILAEVVAFLSGLLRGRWCPMDNSIGEIRGAMKFVFSSLAQTKNDRLGRTRIKDRINKFSQS